MNVIEIFSSIEGEGSRQGFLATFLRLYDCNVRCSYCDTTYSYGAEAQPKVMSLEDLAGAIAAAGNRRITITGGEPLLQEEELWALIDLLNRQSALDQGEDSQNPDTNAECSTYEFNIETNGTLLPSQRRANVFFTFDYKGPSSLVEDQMNLDILDYLEEEDLLKFVVGSQEDLLKMKEILQAHRIEGQVFVSPIWGQIDPVAIVDFLKREDLQEVRLQLQIHKFIWDPDAKGV